MRPVRVAEIWCITKCELNAGGRIPELSQGRGKLCREAMTRDFPGWSPLQEQNFFQWHEAEPNPIFGAD